RRLRRWLRAPIGGPARAGIGSLFLWVPRSVALQSPWPPHHARRFSDVPPPHNMGRGTGGEADATASGPAFPSQTQSPAPHCGALTELQFTTITRSPPDPTPSSPPGTHLRNLRSICVICVPPPSPR